MSMLRTLFFIEAHLQFSISSQHIAGSSNTLADYLSRNQLKKFLCKISFSSSPLICCSFFPFTVAPGSQHGLDISSLDGAVQHFCSQGIAPSTHKTYQAALKKFATFCSTYDILSPFPVSESVLCYFATYLACQRLSPQTIKVYLAAIRYMQITLGLPEPKEYSLMPRLRLVQSGIQRSYFQKIKILQKLDYQLPQAFCIN